MWRHRHSGKIHVTVEAKVAVMPLKARECKRKLATIVSKEETRKDSKSMALERVWLQRERGSAHTLILDFKLLDLGENIFLLI